MSQLAPRVASPRFALVSAAAAALAVAMSALLAAPANAATDFTPPLAVDLFPVDDWVGDGLGGLKDTVFGGLEIGADAIASLIINTLAAIIDLLIPKSFIEAGLGAIKWLCTVPAFSSSGSAQEGAVLTLPHVDELRTTLQWFGVLLLPLGLTFAAARYFIPGGAYDDGPMQILGNVVVAAAWLALYLWGWTAITSVSTMVSDGILSLPWIADGIEDMLQGLVLDSAAPVGPLSEFAVLVVMLLAALAFLALLLLKVALLVVTAFLFVIGGLIGALLPFPFGRRLVQGYLVAVAAVVALPALWAVLFALGSALMIDASSAGDANGGFSGFMQQFFVMGASFATFAVAVKLGLQTFSMATSTITSFTTGALLGAAAGGGGGSGSSVTQAAHRAATVKGMQGGGSGGIQRQAAFSGGSTGSGGGSGGSVRSTDKPAEGLRDQVASSGGAKTAATVGTAVATGGGSAVAGAAAGAAKGGAAGSGAGSLTGSAAQGAPQVAGAVRQPGGEAQTPPVPVSAPGASVRSTGENGDGSRPGPPAAAPTAPSSSESARQTPSGPKTPKGSGSPAADPQNPPRGPRPSSGGKP